jgi:phage shock protein PspC (stress-responsive transcriptional regulator)
LTKPEQTPRPLMTRLIWFVTLWAGGVVTVGLISYILRLWIAPHR